MRPPKDYAMRSRTRSARLQSRMTPTFPRPFFMAITGDDLFDALQGCARLTGSVEENACANGVFMENLVVDGAHGGHYSRYLKPSEPLYPCTAVGEKYKTECFDMQTSYALGVVRGDFAKVFELCAAVGVPYRAACYQSLGRDAAMISLNQVP